MSNQPLSGRVVLVIVLASDAEPNMVELGSELLASFIRGIDLGFFDDSPQHAASVVAGSQLLRADAQKLTGAFEAQTLPPASFRVLAGMIAGHAAHLGLPVSHASARIDGELRELLTSDTQPFRLLPPLPFQTLVPPEGPAFKSLRIWLDFQRDLPEAPRECVLKLFRIWDRLVLGPFPADERPLGDSWAGPAVTSFLLPSRAEHFVEDYSSGPAAFDLLLLALLRLHELEPIDTFEIE